MGRKYLNDEKLNEQLVTDGYATVRLLSDESVDRLLSIFHESHKDGVGPFYATAHHQDTELRKRMSEGILNELSPVAEKVFNQVNLLGGSYIVKTNSDNSPLHPHQDWNIVDEDKFRSFNIWVPLVDLSENNGAIEVLPKSHSWQRGYRHASIPCAYQQVHQLVWDNMKPLFLKAGEALIYDHALLHASKANATDEPRIAVASGVIPSEAQMYFYWNNNGAIAKYESNPEFFMTKNIFEEPKGLHKVADLPYDFPQVDEARFYEYSGITPPPSINVVETVEHSPNTQAETKSRRFWEVYTPLNILREINYRLRSR